MPNASYCLLDDSWHNAGGMTDIDWQHWSSPLGIRGFCEGGVQMSDNLVLKMILQLLTWFNLLINRTVDTPLLFRWPHSSHQISSCNFHIAIETSSVEMSWEFLQLELDCFCQKWPCSEFYQRYCAARWEGHSQYGHNDDSCSWPGTWIQYSKNLIL